MLSIPDLHSWIKGLSEPVKAAVMEQMQPRRYSDGEIIYSLGEDATALYQVQSGYVNMCNYTYSGREIQLVQFRFGDCFGEMGLLENRPRFNNAVAVGDALLNVLHKSAFKQLYHQYSEIPREMNLFFCRRIHCVYTLAEDASVLTVKQRLLRLIARLGYSRGVSLDGVTVVDHVSHEMLAHMLGATRQGVSRELKELEKNGLIQIKYGKILIRELPTMVEEYDHLVGGESVVPQYNKPE